MKTSIMFSVSAKILFIFIIALTIPIAAHSGRTDEDGGHYDHSADEYHYHHGYPAHQHYDMNDDGIIDCPYKFVDTTHASSNITSINNSKSNDSIPSAIATDNGIANSITNESNSSSVTVKTFQVKETPIWIIWTLIVLAVTTISIFFKSNSQKNQLLSLKSHLNKETKEKDDALCAKKKIEKQIIHIEENAKNEIEKVRDLYGEHLAKVQAEYVTFFQKENIDYNPTEDQPHYIVRQLKEIYTDTYILKLCDPPENDFVGEDGLPIHKDTTDCKWGERYTVYYNTTTHKYHRASCIHAQACIPKNIVEIPQYSHPCWRCCPNTPDLSWYYKYISLKNYIEEAVKFKTPLSKEILSKLIQKE